MTKPRRQRKKHALDRPSRPSKAQASTIKREPVMAVTQKPQPKPGSIGRYIDRFDPAPADSAPTKAIQPAKSWRLWGPSFELWLANSRTCIVLLLVPTAITVISFVLGRNEPDDSNLAVASALVTLLGYILLLISIPAMYYLQVRAIHGERPGLWRCYKQGLRITPKLLGLILMTAGIALLGLACLIIPGLIMLRRYTLAPYYLIDLNTSISDAMRRSQVDSKPAARSIWGVYGVYLILNTIGAVTLAQIFPPYGALLLLLITSFYSFALPLRYRELGLRQPASYDSIAVTQAR